MDSTRGRIESLDAACSSIAAEHGGDVGRWLESRWAELNSTRPVVNFSYVYDAERYVPGQISVEADLGLLAGAGRETAWGTINNRAESFGKIVGGALEGFHQGTYCEWLDRVEGSGIFPIHLAEIPGCHGPLYKVGEDGRHRMHVLLALGLKTFPVTLTRVETSTTIDLDWHARNREKTRYLYCVPDGRGFGRWARYDFLALSFMIRGVLSPGSEAPVDC